MELVNVFHFRREASESIVTAFVDVGISANAGPFPCPVSWRFGALLAFPVVRGAPIQPYARKSDLLE